MVLRKLGPLSVESVYDGMLSEKDCALKMYRWGMDYKIRHTNYFEAAKELLNLCKDDDIPSEVKSLFTECYRKQITTIC